MSRKVEYLTQLTQLVRGGAFACPESWSSILQLAEFYVHVLEIILGDKGFQAQSHNPAVT